MNHRAELILFILTLLIISASLPCRSEGIDSADANYCIDWSNRKEDGGARLIFINKHTDLRIPINTQDSLTCVGSYFSSVSSCFYFVDELGKKVFSFYSLPNIVGAGTARSFPRWYTISDTGIPELVKTLPPEILIMFPIKTDYIVVEPMFKSFKKENLLRFKGNIIDANIDYKLNCQPNLDTTYTINFRVKIMGTCDSVFLNTHE